MSLRGFSTISFWADDVAAAAAWYARFLGVEAYFTRPGPDGCLAYAEFRIGDYQAELGNVLGVMYNQHYLDVLASARPA